MSGQESPFSESLRPEDPIRHQLEKEKTVVDLEFIYDGDLVCYRKIFEDKSVSRWHQTNISPMSPPEMVLSLKKRLMKENGLTTKD